MHHPLIHAVVNLDSCNNLSHLLGYFPGVDASLFQSLKREFHQLPDFPGRILHSPLCIIRQPVQLVQASVNFTVYNSLTGACCFGILADAFGNSDSFLRQLINLLENNLEHIQRRC